jgi:hypothetical protein
MSPSTKRKNWSKEESFKILFCAENNSGEVCEGYMPFSRGASKCAFRKKNSST